MHIIQLSKDLGYEAPLSIVHFALIVHKQSSTMVRFRSFS
jgi:hypothetical protein